MRKTSGCSEYSCVPHDDFFSELRLHTVITSQVPLLVVLEVCYTGLNVDARMDSYYYLVTARLNEADLLTGRMSLKVLNLFGVRTPGLLSGPAWADEQLFLASTLVVSTFVSYTPLRPLFGLRTDPPWFVLAEVGSRHRIVLFIAAFFTLVGLAFFMLVSVIEFRSASILDIEGHSWMFSVSYGCSVVADILLSGILVYALLRSRTGAKSTNSVVHTVIVYTINTGAATSITGIVVFALGLVWRDRLTWVGPSLISPKLYANSVLAVLNSRRSLSNRILDGPSELVSVESDLHFRTMTYSSGGVQPELHEIPSPHVRPTVPFERSVASGEAESALETCFPIAHPTRIS
ncbi:hypothetical protein BD413DRAFT_66953 [Trametes elegans]|nr:hypothetical protein BD413DRAFT_66953 [Trametes elegans]